MRNSSVLFFLTIVLSFASCTSPSSETKQEVDSSSTTSPVLHLPDEESEAVIENEGIRLRAVQAEREFPSASLKLIEPNEKIDQGGSKAFRFEVENFELGVQTEGDRSEQLENSEKGQHIHFILNNGLYSAHYSDSFEKELVEGNNVILAFLSRSYHESVKGSEAFIFKNIAVGEDNILFDLQSPHLIYSRPKGSYSAKKDKLLLDFYLINAKLAPNGMKVRAKIDQAEFILSSWQPYIIEGLEKGSHTIRLQLIDSDGRVVPGPFNDSGIREISIE